MASIHKVHKQVNAYGVPQMLKDKEGHCKRFSFFTSSERKRLKDKLSDKEIIEKYNNYNSPNIKPIEIGERKSGNGYNTVDKQWFIRIIKN